MIITKQHLRITVFVSLFISLILFLYIVRNGLYPFVIAFFMAYILNPAVCCLERRGLKRGAAILAVYAVVFSLMLYSGSRLYPVLIRELENFGKDLPALIGIVENHIQGFQTQYQNSALPYSLRVALDERLMFLQQEGQHFITSLVDMLAGLMTHAMGLAITPVLAFYLLCDWHQWREGIFRIFPGRWRQDAGLVWQELDRVLSGVIRGQVTVALIVGILVTTGLYLLDVKYALLIGILAGLLDLIPYFGAIIGATPAVTLALLESPYLAIQVVFLFFVIHQLEGMIIGPKILGENVGLHPLTVIFFVFVGSELGGLAGMLLGVPFAAVGKVLFQHLVRVLV